MTMEWRPISAQISSVLSAYLQARNAPMRGHPTGVLLRRELPDTIDRIILESGQTDDLTAHGSAGMGRWARIPWVAVYHRNETTTAREGVYIVYLFASDMSGVYLTLNQGITNATEEELSRRRENILNTVEQVRGFNRGPLKSGSLLGPQIKNRPHGYETGCIFYKAYDAQHIPSDAVLTRDLLALIQVYNQVVAGTPHLSAETSPGIKVLRELPPAAGDQESLAGDQLREELIARIRTLSPGAFERLLGLLWRRLGYDNVQVLGQTADGGIDGDFVAPLVDIRIMFQAKRYQEGSNISARPIRELIGSVVVGKYDRGIFVTTSAFTAGALEEAEQSEVKIVLLDAQRLVDLMFDVRLGIKSVVERATIDQDVFEQLGH